VDITATTGITGITVTGQGSVQRRPDLARVTLGVRVAERSVADAVPVPGECAARAVVWGQVWFLTFSNHRQTRRSTPRR
jgi:hypothetical protein